MEVFMRMVLAALVAVVVVMILFVVGVFAAPALALVGFCSGPIAFIALGFALGRAGVVFQSPIRSMESSVPARRKKESAI
jgi:hypothetical protein